MIPFCLFYEGKSKAAAVSAKLHYQNWLFRNSGFFISCSLLIKNGFFYLFFLQAVHSLEEMARLRRVAGQKYTVCIKQKPIASDLEVPSELKIC